MKGYNRDLNRKPSFSLIILRFCFNWMEKEESDLSQSLYLACFFAYFETKQKISLL